MLTTAALAEFAPDTADVLIIRTKPGVGLAADCVAHAARQR